MKPRAMKIRIVPSAYRSAHPVAAALIPLLLIFLVLFPKGGIKLAGAPLTWGYMLLGLSAVPLLVARLLVLPLRITLRSVVAFSTLLPLLLLFFYSIEVNGIALLGYAISVFTNFAIFPALFLLVYPSFLPFVSLPQFSRWLRACIFLAALWGIFLFFLHPVIGRYIEIPYLTVNSADVGELELTKHIDRGRFLKLISTYNNGNVYGAATLILLPLYDLLEPRRWHRNLLRLALVLTLSRTVWAGLVAEQLLSLVAQAVENVATFPYVRLGGAARRGLAVLASLGAVAVGLFFTSNARQLLTDRTFGGRTGEIAGTATATWLPTVPVTGFAEILYSGAAINYGYAGLVAVTLIFVAPLGLLLLDRRLLATPSRRAALKGLILYAIISASDGATNLIPVMVFYWFTYMTFLHGLPGEQPQTSADLVPTPDPSSAWVAPSEAGAPSMQVSSSWVGSSGAPLGQLRNTPPPPLCELTSAIPRLGTPTFPPLIS